MQGQSVLRNPWFQLLAITGVLAGGVTVFNLIHSRSPTEEREPKEQTTTVPQSRAASAANSTPAPTTQASFVEYLKAAEAGDSEAQLRVAKCYAAGSGVEQDVVKAFKWMEKAAHSGSAYAAAWLAGAYGSGLGVEPNSEKQLQWTRIAAERGSAEGQLDLANGYETGRFGLPKDPREAAHWYRAAAEQGDRDGQFELGRCYQFGSGVPLDNKEAAKWYKLAAEQNMPQAEAALAAVIFDENPVEAIRLTRSAAEKGDARGQYILGYAYSVGVGVPLDRSQAKIWLQKSAAQGDTDAIQLLRVIQKK